MNKRNLFLASVLTGGSLIYFLDPDRGKRRRALLRDKVGEMARVKRDALNVMLRDFFNRWQGTLHETREMFSSEPVEDRVLRERIRSIIGRNCSHPGAIEVNVELGTVTLTGEVLADEVQSLVRGVKRIRGVRHVDNQLRVHSMSEGIPGLQGPGSLPPESTRMTPATCLMLSGVGLLLSLTGAVRRDMLGGAMGLAGIGLILKSFADVEARFAPAGADPFLEAMKNPAKSDPNAPSLIPNVPRAYTS